MLTLNNFVCMKNKIIVAALTVNAAGPYIICVQKAPENPYPDQRYNSTHASLIKTIRCT